MCVFFIPGSDLSFGGDLPVKMGNSLSLVGARRPAFPDAFMMRMSSEEEAMGSLGPFTFLLIFRLSV